MAGGGRQRHGEAGGPRSRLARLRSGRERLDADRRQALGLAMLEACGERGYREATVQDALDRAVESRSLFYRHFSSKAGAFEAAYEVEAGRLVDAILAAGRTGPSWAEGLKAALAELGARLEDLPALARALLLEAHVAGGGALARRAELLERLAAALDRARGAEGALEDPPALTARFMIGAVDAAAGRALANGDPGSFREELPELTALIVAAYFGERAAASLSPTACSCGRLSPTY